MGACNSENRRRSSFSNNKRRNISSEKDSISTQSYDKRRGKTPNSRINNNEQNRDFITEKEISDIASIRNNDSKLDIMSKIDKTSIVSEKIINNKKTNDSKKKEEKDGEISFNKNIKNKNNTKIIAEYNLHTKFNNFGKKTEENPIKIIESKKKNNNLDEIEKYFNLKNSNDIKNTCIYVIDDEPEIFANFNNIYSNNSDYYNCIKTNLNNRIKLSNDILILPERRWYNELINLSDLLLKMREKLDMKDFKSYLIKIIKIYEDFNWLIDSISTFYLNLNYKNLQFNKEKIGLPEINADNWTKGFKWKGVYIKVNEGDQNKTIINEIKALNYYFFDYLQIIDKYQIIKDNQLSNMIIFPLIGYSIVNGKTLTVSCLINIDNAYDENSTIIKKNNDIIKLYTNIKNNNVNININNLSKNDLNIDNNDENNLLNTMNKKLYIDDLLISKLFYNLNDSNFLKIKYNKYIIFNLYKFIPDLFSIKFDFIKKINFFSKIKNKRIFYSLNYDKRNKTNIHKELSKYKNTKDVLENLYYFNNTLSMKSKDIIINNIHFRILYENETQNLDDIKNNSAFSKNFVDNLFNYNYAKKNISMKTIIKEPYVIIYDLIEPIKLKYSLIKSNKDIIEQNITNNNKDINEYISKKIFYLKSNYLSIFMSWCKSLSQNAFNIKTYSDLKHYMKKYGINSILRFFSLVIIDNPEITDIIKISLLIKGLKFIFNKENNKSTLNYNEEGIKYLLIKYIKSILYPNEILPKEQFNFEIIFKELVFYTNILFLKLKLIDYYLNLDLLSVIDIKDRTTNQVIASNILKEDKIKLISKKLLGFNSPEDFLIHIISVARAKPFLFLSEFEQKLNFIINPFIKFKSSLSIESMSKQLNMNHISINYNYKTFSYIKGNELSGLILAKIINRFNSYDLKGNNFLNNITNNDIDLKNKNGDDDNISYTSSNIYKKNYLQSAGDESASQPYIFMGKENNINNVCEENVTNNSENSKEYTTDIFYINKNNDNNINNNNDNNKQTEKKNNISSANTTRNFQTNNIYDNNDDNINNNRIEWDNIKNEFIFELPSICYKMNYYSDENEKNNKFKYSSLYKNLSNIYNIINFKVIIEWDEIIEEMFNKVYSCNGDTEHNILYSLFYTFIFYFFFDKKREESKKIIKKIFYLYHNGGYKLSLNDLIIINLFQSLLNNNYIKSEENFSKCILLILLSYGEPRGRNNDSHGILEFPLWNICRKTLKFEQIIISENFREMFHALDYFEWKKSLFREKHNLLEKDDIINYEDNAMSKLDEILLINNINKSDFKNSDDCNCKENELSDKIFDEKILELKRINHFNFPKLSNLKDKENTILENYDFILYLMKQIQSLFIGKKIIFNENYIINEISNEIFNPDKDKNIKSIPKNNYTILNNNMNNMNNINKMNNNNINKNNMNLNNINFNYKNQVINKHENYRYNSLINNRLSFIPFLSNMKNSNMSNKFNMLDKNSKQIKRPLSGTNINNKYANKTGNIFSHFLYKELLEKVSYSKNIPSGVVFSFGNNRYNETSHDNLNKLTLPRIIFKLKNEYVKQIYSGWEHNIIINKNGELFSFGHNKNYQCGLPNNNEMNDKINNPTNISIINNNFRAISAACGNEHTLVLKSDNSVYAFGNNEEGELGLEDNNIKTYKFNKINFGKYSNQITQISAGTVHNLALTKDGRVFAWGSSQGGQLGLPEDYLINKPGFKETFFLYEPTIIHINKNLKNNNEKMKNNLEVDDSDEDFIIKVSCGEAHSVALSNNGSVYSWGFGSNGQLGLGFCEDTFEPGYGTKLSRIFTPQYVKNLENDKIIDIQCGKTFSMFINNKKEILACGVNDLNQLGINEPPNMRKNEIICYDIVWPTRLDYLIEQKVEKLSCGEGHCLAIINYPENVRVVWSWGNNKFGQLGHGSWINKSMPKPINYLLGYNSDKVQFEDISCGGFHSLCLINHKEDLSWIEDDFKKIIKAINYKNINMNINNYNNYIVNNTDNDIKSEKITHINLFKL